MFSPLAQFVAGGKFIKVTLNDSKTAVYRDATTGKPVARVPSESLGLPGTAGRTLAVSPDRSHALAVQGKAVSVWRRGK
jgi:hypothetical protein